MLQLYGLDNGVDYLRHVERPGFRQQLIIVGSGTVTLSRRGELVKLQGPVVINHSPLAGISVVEATIGRSWLLTFDGVAMDQLVASAFLLLCPMTGVFHLALKESELTTVQGILALMEEPGLGTDLLMAHTVVLMKYLSRFQNETNSKRFADNDLVRQYVARVDRDHETVHEVATYAEKLGVSIRTLNRVFKQTTGITPKASLNYRLNLSAKAQLQQNSHSVKEISYRLGFTSPAYFHEFFRKSNGQTPGEYARLASGA